jgi:hypothetical protein
MSVFADLERDPSAPRLSDLWEWARDDYLAGESADVVCARHGLSRSRFFERAKAEGWRRRDRAETRGDLYDDEAEHLWVEEALDRAPSPAYALARRAWARAERAVLMNRRTDAQGWVRLARDLRKLAMEEEGVLTWRRLVERREPGAEAPAPVELRPLSELGDPAALARWIEAETGVVLGAEPPPRPDAPDPDSPEPDSPDSVRRTPDSPASGGGGDQLGAEHGLHLAPLVEGQAVEALARERALHVAGDGEADRLAPVGGHVGAALHGHPGVGAGVLHKGDEDRLQPVEVGALHVDAAGGPVRTPDRGDADAGMRQHPDQVVGPVRELG